MHEKDSVVPGIDKMRTKKSIKKLYWRDKKKMACVLFNRSVLMSRTRFDDFAMIKAFSSGQKEKYFVFLI